MVTAVNGPSKLGKRVHESLEVLPLTGEPLQRVAAHRLKRQVPCQYVKFTRGSTLLYRSRTPSPRMATGV
jgi:hypothetical protein